MPTKECLLRIKIVKIYFFNDIMGSLTIAIAVVILLILVLGLWYAFATPAAQVPVATAPVVSTPVVPDKGVQPPSTAPPTVTTPTPVTSPTPTATNTAGVGSLPVTAATPAPGYKWEFLDNAALAGGSGLYGYKSGAVDVFPTWESCRDRCDADANCGGFWWTNPSHQGCYYQGNGSLSFMPGGGGGTKAGIKRFA